jgi:hypothetical protein
MHKSIVLQIAAFFFIFISVSNALLSHDLISEENYNYPLSFYSKIKKIYGPKSLVTSGAARFMHHRWFEAKKDFEKIKNKDARVLFFLYTIYKSYGLEQSINSVIDQIARIPAQKLKAFDQLRKDKGVKEVIYHYYRDHLKPGNGTFEGTVAKAGLDIPSSVQFPGLSMRNRSLNGQSAGSAAVSLALQQTGEQKESGELIQEIIPEAKKFDLKKYGFIDMNSENKALFPSGHEYAGQIIPEDKLIQLSMDLDKKLREDSVNIEK